MTGYLFVALGSAAGGMLRYWLSNYVYKWLPVFFPFGTLTVNFIGSFIIGLLVFGLDDRGLLSPETRLLLTVGFCGGFTTFSTFSLETVNLIKNSEYLLAAINIVASVVLTLAATFLAYVLSAGKEA